MIRRKSSADTNIAIAFFLGVLVIIALVTRYPIAVSIVLVAIAVPVELYKIRKARAKWKREEKP